tara:strand:- start:14 stop:187 length:174 start_codon:yes stop_codon:yes gene_type:complete
MNNYMHEIIKKAIEAGLSTQEYINAMDEAHAHFDRIQELQEATDFENETVTEGRILK